MNIQDFYLEEIVRKALMEDLNRGDVTTDSIVDERKWAKGAFIAKEKGVIAGLPVAKKVFRMLDEKILLSEEVKEGQKVSEGQVIARIEGPAASILKGERTALNFMQRMSGIATKTKRCADMAVRFNVKILDTRKTVPGLRVLDKYSIMIGGGHNHRFSLSDGVLIKDNHIKAAGSVAEAVKKVRERVSHTLKVEVEVETLNQLAEALEAGADIVLLDNMDPGEMEKAAEIAKGKVLLEASGNVTEQNLESIAATGVDMISIGSLTHSVKALDISLRFE